MNSKQELERKLKAAKAEHDEGLALIRDLFNLVECSKRWFHDSQLWEAADYDDYLPPQWNAIRARYAELLKKRTG